MTVTTMEKGIKQMTAIATLLRFLIGSGPSCCAAKGAECPPSSRLGGFSTLLATPVGSGGHADCESFLADHVRGSSPVVMLTSFSSSQATSRSRNRDGGLGDGPLKTGIVMLEADTQLKKCFDDKKRSELGFCRLEDLLFAS